MVFLMKNKYQRLNKKEKEQIKKEFYNTELGKTLNIRLTRLLFTGLIGILFSLYIIANDYKNKISWMTWFLSIPLLIFSLIFIFMSFKLRIKNLNDYVINKKND